MAALTGQTVEPLGKGAGVLLVEDGGRFSVKPLYRSPDLRSLRESELELRCLARRRASYRRK